MMRGRRDNMHPRAVASTGHQKGNEMARRHYQKGSLVLKGKTWHLRWLDYTFENGKKIQVHRSIRVGLLKDFPTKKLARREAATTMSQVNSPLYKPERRLTFLELAAKWENCIMPQHKPSSQNSEKVHLQRFKDYFGSLVIDQVSIEAVQQWVTQAQMGPKTVRNYVATLKLIFKSGATWGYVKSNPCLGLVLPRLNEVPDHSYTPEQIQQIIAEAEEPYRTLFWIVAETGMRGGEVCGLTVDCVNLEDGTIEVKRSAWQGKLQTPKTATAIRLFPISPMLVAHLKGQVGTGRQGLMFSSPSGKPLDNYSVVRYVLHPITDKLGMPRYGLHAFRHANATAMDRHLIPMAVREARLGHTKMAMTMRYTHAVGADSRRAAEILGGVFCPTLSQTAGCDTKDVT